MHIYKELNVRNTAAIVVEPNELINNTNEFCRFDLAHSKCNLLMPESLPYDSFGNFDSSNYAKREIETFPLGAYAIKNVRSPYRFILTKDDNILGGRDLIPSFYLDRMDYVLNSDECACVEDVVECAEPVFMPFFWKHAEYGHFLIEALPRLIAIRTLADFYPFFRNISVIVPKHAPLFVRKYIDHILPNFQFIEINEYKTFIKFRTVLIPICGSSDHCFNALQSRLLDDIVLKPLLSSATANGAKAARKIAISRIGFHSKYKKDFRLIENEEKLVEMYKKYDFDVIEPELLDPFEQVKVFAEAGFIIGESSSALHNTIWSPAQARVCMLNEVNSVQALIAALKRHSFCTVRPSDGIFRKNSSILDIECLSDGKFKIDEKLLESLINHI